MNKILLWIASIVCILMGLISLPTSIVASLSFLIAGAYLSPFVRSKYLANLSESIVMGKKAGIAIVSVLIVIAVAKIGGVQDEESIERTVKSYQTNPAAFLENVKNNADAKKFYLARGDLDRVIPSLPNDQALKNLRHEITLAEMKSDASNDKLYQFTEQDFARYKEIMGASAKTDDVQKQYTELATQNVNKLLAKEDTVGAKVQIDRLNKIAPSNSVAGNLNEQIATVDRKIKAREEALAKKKAEEEAAAQRNAMQSSSTSSVGGMSRVVSKVGSLIYLANGQTFAIERPTMLHIDGQIYPKGSGSPDYIQVGYRCRFTGDSYSVAEVFCER